MSDGSVTPLEERQLHLGFTYWANGSHPAGWRYPRAQYKDAFDAEYIVTLAQIVEAASFDFFYFGDQLATDLDYEYTNTSALAGIEPFTTAAYLATRTSKIGFVVTANPEYFEPYNLARLTASLDHVTHGRAAWNVFTDPDRRAAANYSRGEHTGGDDRQARADEFTSLVRALWDSWEDGAFLRNKETGEFVEASKIHVVDHHGTNFDVKGPLNVARPPQGNPVIFHAPTSDRSRDFGAREADVVLAEATTISEGIELADDIRRRAAQYGRNPQNITIVSSFTPVVGRTLAEARAIYDALNELIVLDEDIRYGGVGPEAWSLDGQSPRPGPDVGIGLRNLGALSRWLGTDVTAEKIDGVVESGALDAFNPLGKQIASSSLARTGRRAGVDLTWRDLLYTTAVGGHVAVGGPNELADHVQNWFLAGAADGFNVQPAFLTNQLTDFVDLVVPELRDRGLHRDSYDGPTLRDHLGLSRPISKFVEGRPKENVS